MTIKQYFSSGGKWDIQCSTGIPYRAMSVNVGFLNDRNEEDEVQFDIHAYDVNELCQLFNDFCRENNFPANTVMYIAVVETAETMKALAAHG